MSDSWLEDVVDEETALEVQHTVAPSPFDEKAQKQEELKRIEDRVFEEAAEVCSMAMKFGDIEPGLTEPPVEWVEELGQEKADRMLRYVTAAQMSSRDAPAGIKVATTVLTGLIRSRAERPTAPRMLIMPVVLSVDAPGEARVYPTQIVED